MDVFVSYVMTPLMCLEILVAEYLFALKFPRKNYFYARFIGSGISAIYITVWIEIIYGLITGNNFNYNASGDLTNTIFKIFYYIAIFSMTIFCVWFSYKQSFTIILVCCSLGYAMQFLASNLGSLFNPLGSNLKSPWSYIYTFSILIITRVFVYFIIYHFEIKKHPKWDESNRTSISKILLFLLVVLMCIGLSRLSIDDVERSLLAKIVEPIIFMMISVLVILMQFSIADNESITNELATTKAILHQEREQYALSKENIEIINEKCHDLKHQISLLRENSSENKIAEVEKAVMIYDSTIKTGNDVLDILLTEKKLYCDSRNIKFTLVANGKLLSFMDDMDLYSLLGNAISNAIESVSQLTDNNKKHISLKIHQVGSLVSIHVENYYSGDVRFENGLPQTSKNTYYHGFGMKSMERIVNSYQGTMNITAENGLFKLDILLPINH